MADTLQKVKDIFFSGPGIKVKYSTLHLIMPTIVICILILLALIMLVTYAVKCAKQKKPFLNLKGWHFFAKGFSPLVFFGTIALLIVYFLIMPSLRFVHSSVIILFALNLLYTRPISVKAGKIALEWKPIGISAAVSAVGPVAIWAMFYLGFGLTLP